MACVEPKATLCYTFVISRCLYGGVEMKKKALFVLLLLVVFSFGILASCSSSSSDEPKYADKDFIKSVSKGLEARWKLQDAQTDDSVENLKKAIQAELDEVAEYKNATFEDSVLQEKALKYINVLNESLENAEYYKSVDEYQKWGDIYDQRTIILKDFVDNYELKVSDKYQSTFDELIANGKTAGAKTAQKEAIQKIVDNLEFELKEDDGYGWKKYEAIFENTTEYEIVELGLDLSLLDEDDVIVATEYAHVDNVSKGQKAKVEFSTDKSFERIEPIINYLEAK